MVSIIIPTLNEEKFLPRLLTSLKEQTFRDFEVIVADAHSTDTTRQIASEFGAKVVDGGSISVGRNKGATNAEGDILIFIDADITFDKKFLEDSLAEFEKKGFEVAITYFDKSFKDFRSKSLYHLSDFSKYITQRSKNKFGTCQCVFIRKEIFTEIGGFNELAIIGEDIEFMKKISLNNHRYGVLNTKITASDRRFRDVGIIRVLAGSIFIALMAGFGLYRIKKLQNFTEKVYGGWGKW